MSFLEKIFGKKLETKQDAASSYIPISSEAKNMIESGLKILEYSIDIPNENLTDVSKDIEGNQPNELPSRIFVESLIDSNGKEFPNPIQLSFQKTESMIIYIARNTIDESILFETEVEAPGFRAENVVGVGKLDKKKQDEVFIYDSLHKLYSMYDNYMNKNDIIFRDTVYVIKIKNPISYPVEKENRRTTFGDPLSSIFGLNFDEIAIEYFKDSENRLYEIAVGCFKSKVKCKKEDEMPELNVRLFKLYSDYVYEFFKGINIEAEIVNVCLPSNSKISLADYAIERMNSQKENAGREVIEEKEFKPAIIKLETGKLDLITNRGKLNMDDFIFDERTSIQMTEDGRFLAGFISKKDGTRYYTEVPEEQGRKWWNEVK